jgi:hypothetical protein
VLSTQNRLARDYSLASGGGVCEKFNLSNCCSQVDDEGKVIEEITVRMRKIAMSLSKLREDEIPMNCLEDGYLPWVDSKL